MTSTRKTSDESFLRDFRDTLREYQENGHEYSDIGKLNLVAVLGERSPRLVSLYDAAIARAEAAELKAQVHVVLFEQTETMMHLERGRAEAAEAQVAALGAALLKNALAARRALDTHKES